MASGFALRRNGACLATETDCGETHFPFHGCCPLGSFCPGQYNIDCCATETNCTEALLPDPQCANAEWDLFTNGGYFCCLHGLAGYARPGNSDGCAEAGYKFKDGEQLLRTISTGTVRSAITTSHGSTTSSSQGPSNSNTSAIPSSPLSTAPATVVTIVESIGASTPQPTSSSASIASTTPKVATIVGGSVGAVLAVTLLAMAAWFLLIRRRRKRQPKDRPLGGAHIAEADHVSAIHEKDSRDHVLEMPTKNAHEKNSGPIFELTAARTPEMPA